MDTPSLFITVCPRCNGKGSVRVIVEHQTEPTYTTFERACSACAGSGEIPVEKQGDVWAATQSDRGPYRRQIEGCRTVLGLSQSEAIEYVLARRLTGEWGGQ